MEPKTSRTSVTRAGSPFRPAGRTHPGTSASCRSPAETRRSLATDRVRPRPPGGSRRTGRARSDRECRGHLREHIALRSRSSSQTPRAGGSIADQRQHLHQVVLHHIPKAANCVVEPAPVLDAEVLRHRDLDALRRSRGATSGLAGLANRRYMISITGSLPRKWSTSRSSPFIEHLVQAGAQLLCGCEVVPERLLHRHVRIPEQADGIQPVHDRREQRRRRLQVVQRPPGPASCTSSALYSCGPVTSPAR